MPETLLLEGFYFDFLRFAHAKFQSVLQRPVFALLFFSIQIDEALIYILHSHYVTFT